eukprot:1158995-Pelagomonas_calceolata.AAC.5
MRRLCSPDSSACIKERFSVKQGSRRAKSRQEKAIEGNLIWNGEEAIGLAHTQNIVYSFNLWLGLLLIPMDQLRKPGIGQQRSATKLLDMLLDLQKDGSANSTGLKNSKTSDTFTELTIGRLLRVLRSLNEQLDHFTAVQSSNSLPSVANQTAATVKQARKQDCCISVKGAVPKSGTDMIDKKRKHVVMQEQRQSHLIVLREHITLL